MHQLIYKNQIPAKEWVKPQSGAITLSEGEQIALEVTNQLLPPPELSQKISDELKLIKYKYRVVSKISHQRKWVPGELISTKITAEQIRQVNSSSEYGPLVNVTTIDLLPFYIVSILSFNKPYNPLVLGEMLKFQYGFSSSPNSVYYDGDDIFYDLSSKTYIFKRRGCVDQEAVSTDSPPPRRRNDGVTCGEDSKHYWEFVVTDDDNVRLVKEYDIDGDGNRSFNRKYNSLAIIN